MEQTVSQREKFSVKDKLVCQWRQICRNGNYSVKTDSKHECFKKFCNICNKKQPSGHFCYVAPLKPSKLSDNLFYVFFDTECTQDLEKRDGFLNMYRTSYLLNNCVLSVKQWMI